MASHTQIFTHAYIYTHTFIHTETHSQSLLDTPTPGHLSGFCEDLLVLTLTWLCTLSFVSHSSSATHEASLSKHLCLCPQPSFPDPSFGPAAAECNLHTPGTPIWMTGPI